jgi:DegV family protein with EDD domain
VSGIHVCTDSSALLSEQDAVRLRIAVVPVPVALDGEPFEGSVDDFYDRVAAGARATTSAPSPGVLLAAYRAAAEHGASEVLSLHLDARLSSTVACAELAARDAPIPVTVVDTSTASFGVALCVREAARALRAGASAREAAALARRFGSSLQNAFAAPGAPGGRVGGLSGWSIMRLAHGASSLATACASPAEAVAAMLRTIRATPEPLGVAIGHAAVDVEPWASALARALKGEEQIVSVERYRVAPAVGAHTGPSVFGAFWWTLAPASAAFQ